ncbi:MAG: Sec-independent protein translocase subunit TatB [Rhodoferax sp.]|jgi:sec-independent protein translocase protein TatB|nr:Sec-independent protein translocase subunit TatB [Rhodoferax sp.]
MLDIGVTKLAIIGAIALVVIGPERLPGVARMAGTLLGRARNYMAEVKAEVNRSMELDELRKMKDTVASAARDVEQSIQSGASDFEKSWAEATQTAAQASLEIATPQAPQYQHPNKHWRVKQGAMPNWYKARAGVRTKALSGAARVARFRPPKIN